MEFKTIGLFGHMRSQDIRETVAVICSFLRDKRCRIVLESSLAESLNSDDTEVANIHTMGSMIDLALVIGGDGALLSTARAMVSYNVPLLGINRGSLGFLTDVRPAEVEQKLDEILAGKFTTERRFLLETLISTNDITQSGHALNEIVLSAQGAHHLIQYEIYVDKQFVCRQRADGLIIGTPTGSTAYALSAGGPIIHPELNALTLVPMFPHTLSMRPIVINGDSTIVLRVKENLNSQIQISCDSQTFLPVTEDSLIEIKKKEQSITLIHPNNYNYYKSLRSKLLWGTKLT
ncbi:MAG: NAD(+) kinase [Gammaproteobacteria bacterium]|nr:NAD(+) kinase [Gammaproteobacteria bacterium]